MSSSSGGRGARVRCVLGGEPRLTAAEPEIAALTGYSATELASGEVPLRSLFHAGDADVARALLEGAAASGALNFRLRRKDGKITCVRCTFTRSPKTAAASAELELILESATELATREPQPTLDASFGAMMENTDDFIYFKDRNHVFTGASQTIVRVTDPTEHWRDLLGKTDYDVFPEEYADRYYELEKRVFAGEEIVQEIQPYVDAKLGTPGWIDNRKYPIRDAAGNIVGLFGVARDITVAHMALGRQRDALERLEQITSQMPGVAYQFQLNADGSMSFPFVSETGREIFGVTPAEAYADPTNVFSRFHPDDLPGMFGLIQTSARDMTPFSWEFRVPRADGPMRFMIARSVPRRLEGGAVLWNGFANDITEAAERKQAEAELRIAATAFESQEAMIVTDASSVILKVNRAFTRITGYSAAEAVGKTPRLMASGQHPPAFYAAMWETLERTGAWQGEIQNRRKSGELYPAWLSITAVKGSEGRATHYVGTTTDITERRRLEDQLRHSQKLEAVGQLAGGIAHDFNNLLTLILSYSTLAIEGMTPNDPLRHDIGEVRKAAEHAKTLTQQLLAFSRKQVLEPQTLDMNGVVSGAVKLLQRLVGEKIEIVTSYARDLGAVRADRSQMNQVIMNLAINARDAMPAGGTLTVATANVFLDAAALDALEGGQPSTKIAGGEFVELTVRDTGTGIDPAARERLFEPFFTTKEQGKGTGLGLSMVYGIVKQSGGAIHVASEPGRGTTFKIYLPRRIGSQTGMAAVREPAAVIAKARPGAGETILVVEDAEQVRKLTSRILQQAGYKVLSAASGDEALELAKGHAGEIHLLLTDVVMPKMNGTELASRFSAARPTAKVLYMSGYTGDALGSQGVLDESTNFLGKPFTAVGLTNRVRDLLEGGRAH